MEWILQAPVLFFSVIVHEFAHGLIAYRKGDDTAYLSGRLTLNPLPHIDLMGTIVMPVICAMAGFPILGWAKPVPVNPRRMGRPRHDMALVALSGPVSNLLLAMLSFLLWKIFALGFLGADLSLTLLKALQFGVIINLALALFNLIPVSPLDGSNIMLGWLSGSWLENYEKHVPYGMYIILALVLTGLLRYLIWPPILLVLAALGRLGFVPL
ncbi:MAG TPA: site-2 protease family protein [Elusimicrobia bacterium]|nr:site-2 protease family protein [Elusimicrobiota bacterium]